MLYGLMFTSHKPFQLSPQDLNRLQQIVRTTTLSAGLVRRARVLLLLAEGVSLRQIQAQTGMSPRRTLHWKKSWLKQGLDGLLDARARGDRKNLRWRKRLPSWRPAKSILLDRRLIGPRAGWRDAWV